MCPKIIITKDLKVFCCFQFTNKRLCTVDDSRDVPLGLRVVIVAVASAL